MREAISVHRLQIWLNSFICFSLKVLYVVHLNANASLVEG